MSVQTQDKAKTNLETQGISEERKRTGSYGRRFSDNTKT